MLPVRILIPAAPLILAACIGSGNGGLRIDPPPAEAAQACAQPATMLGARDWEILAGRLGDALLECEGRRALAVTAYERVRGAVGR